MSAICIKLLYFVSSLCCVLSQRTITEEQPCFTEGLNGTCVSMYRCRSATYAFIYYRAGYGQAKIPKFPEICSYDGRVPIVCCTDCEIPDDEVYKNNVVQPNGYVTDKVGPKALDKCLDYFQKLPYKCRGSAGVEFLRELDPSKTCYLMRQLGWLGVGGRDAERWEFPHMALLGYGTDQEAANWLCGGSIISESFVLTAAHCTYTKTFGPVTFAALGLLKRSDPLEYWNIFEIKRRIRHPEYKPPSKYHDIALLQTEKKIKFTPAVLPACLSIDSDKILYADASGWGQIGHKNPLANTLQVMQLERYKDLECSSLYPVHRHLKGGFDRNTQMCFGVHGAIVDTCQGDSGGPIQINELKCLYTVIGVTSYGKDCGIRSSAGIYTKVSPYVPWIESIVWPN